MDEAFLLEQLASVEATVQRVRETHDPVASSEAGLLLADVEARCAGVRALLERGEDDTAAKLFAFAARDAGFVIERLGTR